MAEKEGVVHVRVAQDNGRPGGPVPGAMVTKHLSIMSFDGRDKSIASRQISVNSSVCVCVRWGLCVCVCVSLREVGGGGGGGWACARGLFVPVCGGVTSRIPSHNRKGFK